MSSVDTMGFLYSAVEGLRTFLWQGPVLWLILWVACCQTYRLRGIQFRWLGRAISCVLKPHRIQLMESDSGRRGDLSPFEALMTSLAGAIGVGNIAGIATAVYKGGYGALFWMWVIALLGMATAYSETLLSMRYRMRNARGEMSGGPMYTLSRGLHRRKLGMVFAGLAALAALGTGCMVQANSVKEAWLTLSPGADPLSVSLALFFLVALVVWGGIKSIGRVAGLLVPFMGGLYLVGGLLVIVAHGSLLPATFVKIVKAAFTGQAVAGAGTGITVWAALQMGASKGLFSNESGLGTLAIAAASARTRLPGQQGLLAMAGVFVSTILICSVTGLVLAIMDALPMAYEEQLNGAALVIAAFGRFLPGLRYVVVVGMILFAFTTLLAWCYYGEKCAEFLGGLRVARWYRFLYVMVIVPGGMLHLEFVWGLADVFNALMVVPNLISILGLSHVVLEETERYEKEMSIQMT